MKFSDTLSGLLLVVFGGLIVAYALTFPATPGAGVGPGFFPIIAGAGLVLCGVVLAWSGRRQRDVAWLELEEWVRRPRMAFNAVLVVGALLFYALAVETVGFFATGFTILAALFVAFGVRRRWIVPLAAGVTLGLHFAFYTLLRVPLPWGWLEGIAW